MSMHTLNCGQLVRVSDDLSVLKHDVAGGPALGVPPTVEGEPLWAALQEDETR